MRLFDLLNLSIKNIKNRWAVLTAFSVAVGAFCLCFAGAAFVTVRQEKSLPFELVVSDENSTGVDGATLAEINKIVGVEDVTPVIEIPAQVNMGGYSTELVLTGINPSYLKSEIPETSVMPYIILNEAACRLFSKNEPTDMAADEVPQIDWLNTKVTVTMDEESSPVTAKVCGIQESEKDDEAAAYISLSAAKRLLRDTGQPAAYTTVYVRIKNIGCAKSVTKGIDALGLSAVNMDTEIQTKWDIQTKEIAYLAVLGAFCLVFSTVLLFIWRYISLYGQKDAYIMLYWLGVRQKTIAAKILPMQYMLISLTGICIGVFAAIVLPSFLSQDLKGRSVFMIPIPAIVIAGSIILCMGINIPVWFGRERI